MILLCACGISQAQADDPTDLESITVEGVLFYIPSGSFGSFITPPPPWDPEADSFPETDTELTLESACSILADIKPVDNDPDTPVCSLSNFKAAPGFPSFSGATWHGNGCGTGGIGDVAPWMGLGARHPSEFSGNLDFPLKNYPSVSFTPACNGHDGCYTTAGSSKSSCDNAFQASLNGICNGLNAGAPRAVCGMFASDYFLGVHDHGADAYKIDQAIAQCAAWGNAMKKNGCDE